MEIDKLDLPKDLISVLGGEQIVFLVKSRRRKPMMEILLYIFLGLAFSTPLVISYIEYWEPLSRGEEIHFQMSGKEKTASWDNLQPIFFPAFFSLFFSAIGLGILIWGLSYLFMLGGYFIGTKSRLISYYRGNISSFNWELFAGYVGLNNKSGSISLVLKTEKMDSSGNKLRILYISGVKNVLEIEKICRQRIEECSSRLGNSE